MRGFRSDPVGHLSVTRHPAHATDDSGQGLMGRLSVPCEHRTS
ncbi:hypothetical protein ACIA8G_15630 [Lentzea sp. NPDC051213]